MDKIMKENLNVEKSMGLADIFILTETNMREIGKMIKRMEKGHIITLMVIKKLEIIEMEKK